MNRKLKMTCEQLNQIVALAKDNEGLDIALLAEAMGLTEKEEEEEVEKKTASQEAYDNTPKLTAALAVPEPKQVEFDTDRHPNSYARWAKHEDDLLKEELIKFGEPRKVPQESIEALSELTGRTEKAVRNKLYKLRKTLTPETSAWTTGEENKLISLYEGTGIPIRMIGKELGRSGKAVTTRIKKLRNEGRITTYRVAPEGGSNENRNQNK